uniref:G-protein coupled receptors family 1 profile domain-containing protein n=1 Tax=Plectus sambesii TaxID=2011161 RepID=A0A914V191_9BILA
MVAANMTLGSEHNILGAYLIGSGFVAGISNLLGLMAFWWYPHVLCTPSAIPEVALLLSDLCVACIHPFSGFAAIKNEWVWGEYGCQLYSFFGFLFGNFQCLCVPFVAFDRFIESDAPPLLKKLRTKRIYARVFILLFLLTFIWAVTPLPIIGWA